ncbi:MAG: hypothetical protein ACRDNX_06095, partial [Gaiellaceae bacterium]
AAHDLRLQLEWAASIEPAARIDRRSPPLLLTAGVALALAERERLVAAGLERAKEFSWTETARRTAEVYRQVIGG